MKRNFDYDKELEKFCRTECIWNEEEQRPTKFVINTLRTITVTHPDGYEYQQNVHDGFTTQRPKQETCQYCFERLTGNHRKFCSPRCVDLYGKIKKKRIELNAESIYIKKDPNGFPQWKDMMVTYRGENKELITKKHELTKKSGRSIKKSSESHTENFHGFSEGIDN